MIFKKITVAVTVPDVSDFQANKKTSELFLRTRAMTKEAIDDIGLALAASAMLSAITRELRAHLTVEQAQDMLQQFVKTMPEAARYDAPRQDS